MYFNRKQRPVLHILHKTLMVFFQRERKWTFHLFKGSIIMCIILPAPSDRRQTAPCSVKFGLKLDVSVLGWTDYSRYLKMRGHSGNKEWMTRPHTDLRIDFYRALSPSLFVQKISYRSLWCSCVRLCKLKHAWVWFVTDNSEQDAETSAISRCLSPETVISSVLFKYHYCEHIEKPSV